MRARSRSLVLRSDSSGLKMPVDLGFFTCSLAAIAFVAWHSDFSKSVTVLLLCMEVFGLPRAGAAIILVVGKVGNSKSKYRFSCSKT